ncbi:MAG: DNA primase [Candidatus Omnitrophica bacterium]|nr:DNA primase [Candidatus Omnitrophota bacterium]MDD5352335.1 DNA primase [Candidatus Omnitrophota bacterium]MDD5549933.1 DNA primase [Candidatus Omnitrophota bacterium]
MPKTIPPEVINDIQDRCDIVELISSYIPLKKTGRNFQSTCPFHSEKTPSFIVSPEKQIYHCFGCGEGGNALSFLMKYEHLNFREAVETLAKRVGVAIQFEEKETDQEKTYTNEIYRINELACDFYQNNFINKPNAEVNKYLKSRNLKEDTLKKFKIGLAPNQWDNLLNYLRAKSINIKLIEKAGLIIAKENGGFYDRFRNRLVIPIFDVKNRIIAFGARALDDSTPKYINSPETPIYIKGRNLFGLNLAKDAIREKDYCIITEGYFDVITPMQEGLSNIVCSSGTALTIEQIRLLKRYTKNVVVIYDADTAGQLATLRSLYLFLDEDMNVKIVNLPKGFDPDLFVRKFGIEKFKNLVDSALDIFEYKLKVVTHIYDVKKISEKTKIALEMLSMIKRMKNEVLKSEYLKLLAERISINEDSLLKELNKIKPSQTTDNTAWDSEKNISQTYPKNERMLIKLILEDTKITDGVKGSISPGDLQDKRLQKILALVFKLYDSYSELKPNQIINYLDDENCIKLISELTSEEILNYETVNRDNILQGCIKEIKNGNIKMRCQILQTKIQEAESQKDNEGINKLKEELNTLNKKRGRLNEKNRN